MKPVFNPFTGTFDWVQDSLLLDQTTPQTLSDSPNFTCDLTAEGLITRQGYDVARDVDGNIETVTYDNGRVVTYTRDVDGVVTSYSDTIYKWTINRDVDGVFTGIDYEEL